GKGVVFFFSSRRRHTSSKRDWSSDVCSSDLDLDVAAIPEVQLRVGVRARDEKPVDRFTREIAPLILNGPPSVTGFAGGRPKPEEIVAYWPALIDKHMVQSSVQLIAA